MIRGYAAEACNAMAPGDTRCQCIIGNIAEHDSAFATAGVGKKTNNPCNIRPIADTGVIPSGVFQSPGNGYFASYDTLRDGTYACVDLYVRKYQGAHPDTITRKWAGNPQSRGYWDAIRSCYDMPPPHDMKRTDPYELVGLAFLLALAFIIGIVRYFHP